MNIVPKTFIGKLDVGKLSLLKNGLPYSYHRYVGFDLQFKTVNYSENGKMTTHSAVKQATTFHDLGTKLLTKPMIIAIGSHPTDVGCVACAVSLLYKIHDNHKTFNIVTLSSLVTIPKDVLAQEYAPEVVCILDLVEDATVLNIENARTLMSIFANSVLIVPAVTKNIVDFFKNRLHKNALFLQVGGIKRVEEV